MAAFQAICVYFLLRLSERDDDVTDFDIPLIQTMTVCTHSEPWGALLIETCRNRNLLRGSGELLSGIVIPRLAVYQPGKAGF